MCSTLSIQTVTGKKYRYTHKENMFKQQFSYQEYQVVIFGEYGGWGKQKKDHFIYLERFQILFPVLT